MSCRHVVLLKRRIAPRCGTFARRCLSTAKDSSPSNDDTELLVVESALKQVPEYGWTNDAIAAGVLEAKLPPTLAGLVSPEALVAHVMESGNAHLRSELERKKEVWSKEEAATISIRSRLVECLKTRLEYIFPYIEAQRWHQAMALGAMPPNNVTLTAKQLNELVTMISEAILVGTTHAPLGPLEQTAIGAVYASTELFLLTDKSQDYADSWEFLEDRVRELDVLASSNILTSPQSLVNGDTAVAMSAVAMSLGGAVLSLVQPTAKGAAAFIPGNPVTQFANSMFSSTINDTAPAGTSPSDYEATTPDTKDLPPFPSDIK